MSGSAAALTALLCGCTIYSPSDASTDSPSEASTLEVESYDWNGWESPMDDPDITTMSIDAEPGTEFTVTTVVGTVTFTIVGADEDGVALSTDTGLVDTTATDGVDLDGGATSFTVPPDGMLELTTPTMDAGTIIEVTAD